MAILDIVAIMWQIIMVYHEEIDLSKVFQVDYIVTNP